MKLTIQLLRADVKLRDDIFRSTADPIELKSVGSGLPDTRAILVKSREKRPGWASDVQDVFDVLPLVTDQHSAGVVILIERKARVFAVTFGIGFQVIESVYIEQGFGLRVAANVIASGKIRGAQTRGIATNSRDQRTVLPNDGDFGDLDIEVDDDWMRQINGKAEDGGFASTLAGGDSLRLNVPNFGLRALPGKIDEVFQAYERDSFKVKFPFLDQMRPLGSGDSRLPGLLVNLRQLVADGAVAYAAPDPFTKDEDSFHHYELVIRRSRWILADLDAAEILTLLESEAATLDWLQDVKVLAVDADGDLVDRIRPLFAYVVAEVEMGAERFFVTAANWFIISADFVAQVERAVARIPDVSDELVLPAWDVADLQSRSVGNHREEVYNRDLADSRSWALLDKKLAYYGVNNKIEVADVLTDDGRLLCIKTASNSPGLSHLVAQATVSAGLWGSAPHVAMLRAAWSQIHGEKEPLLRRDQAEYVLAIATERPGALHDTLYFFTKVLLANALRSITSAGLRVAIARIDMKVPPLEKKIRTRNTKATNGVHFE
ncbi:MULTISPECIES: DUF6119 family protein [unclassified Curtobacterium]|uniref:DUF6119 family protein n=1 Tax=unclassified Curtobacterium TaxID=257496 RepID=UPI0039AFC739